MIIRRLAALAGAVTVASLVPALPAVAHGAPTAPISRTAACASGGSEVNTAACKAARAANGAAFGNFDNLRVANVDGNDRKFVPDGKLCSGGLDDFQGLDLARDDFPATTVSGGQTLKIKYRTTIPHAGSFRVYLTRTTYDPAAKLTWDDLGSAPIAEVTDPPVVDGSYTFSAKLPQRTGRQILYIVWQTSSTPDSYYSCSDLAFKAAAKPATTKPKASAKPVASTAGAPVPAATTEAAAAPAVPAATVEPPRSQSFTPVSAQSSVTLGHRFIAGALLLAICAGAWALFSGSFRRRRENR
jgi:predicted carbohydrate-binding protein with CBM5 and CBM33 domain